MSDDTTFDMVQAGEKIRVLDTALYDENDYTALEEEYRASRELQRIRSEKSMKLTQREIDKLAQDMNAELARLTTQAAQNKRRIAALEGEQNGGDDLPEYSVTVNRTKGTVGDDR